MSSATATAEPDYADRRRPLPPVHWHSPDALLAEAVRRHPEFTRQASVNATAAWEAARAVRGLTDTADAIWQWFRRREQVVVSAAAGLRRSLEAAAVLSAIAGLSERHRSTLAGDYSDRPLWTGLTGNEINAAISRLLEEVWASHPALRWYYEQRTAEHATVVQRLHDATDRAQAAHHATRPAVLLAELRAAGIALALGARPRGGLVVPRNGPPLTVRQLTEIAQHRAELVVLLEAEADACAPMAV